ncbi:hypothetical protein BGW42_007906, partial [Actinomortierella wolfii]
MAAPALTFHDLHDFYKMKIVDHHELDILGESSRQVVNSGHHLASLLEERHKLEVDQRKRNVTEAESSRKKKRSRKKASTEDAKATIHKTHTESRIRRYNSLDKKRFWRLRSGRVVETVLHEASLQPAAHTRHFLYHKDPSPFLVDDLSESWWARKSWAALHDLLDDIPSIFMVDGEKRGLDSSRRRNMGREFNPEEPARRRCGRKLDLVSRRTTPARLDGDRTDEALGSPIDEVFKGIW